MSQEAGDVFVALLSGEEWTSVAGAFPTLDAAIDHLEQTGWNDAVGVEVWNGPERKDAWAPLREGWATTWINESSTTVFDPDAKLPAPRTVYATNDMGSVSRDRATMRELLVDQLRALRALRFVGVPTALTVRELVGGELTAAWRATLDDDDRLHFKRLAPEAR